MDTAALKRAASRALQTVAVDADAPKMQAYMKSSTPYYGVKATPRRQVFRELKADFPVETRDDFERAVLALWSGAFREERYLAIDFATAHKRFHDVECMPLLERLIREGAWWDYVDAVVGGVVSPIYRKNRAALRPKMQEWIDDDHMWVRRAALLAQLKHKSETDEDELFSFCIRRAHEKEFFIRKAIGWMLREYARSAPDAVRKFLREHGEQLSGLSRREAAKHLG